MAEKEKTFEKENLAKINEISITKKSVPVRKHQVKQQAILPSPSDFYKAFDDTFERFRRDFEDVLFPTYWDRVMSLVPEMRIPAVDLEDREKDFILKVEMPGFKKEDIATTSSGLEQVVFVSSSIDPPRFSTFDLTMSRPTPRPDISVVFSAVDMPAL